MRGQICTFILDYLYLTIIKIVCVAKNVTPRNIAVWNKMAASCTRVLWRGRVLIGVDGRCTGIACRGMSTREGPVLRKPNVAFSDKRVQGLLRKLTGMDLNKVFKRRREELEVPKYQLMTDRQLKQVILAVMT